MKKRLLAISICAVLFVSVSGLPVCAADKTVSVTIADFPVTLNGIRVENAYREYPLLVYNEITYFPMTWWGSRWMGLRCFWTQEAGLSVFAGNPDNAVFRQDVRETPNAAKYTATVASGTIRVNETLIDNDAETYPLLVFREITYFPLTWAFCVDEFGWKYSYTHETGLVISSADSSVNYGGYEWAIAENGNGFGLMRGGESVYVTESGAHSPKLEKRGENLYFVYWIGNIPTTSQEHIVQITPHGMIREICSGRYAFYDFGDVIVRFGMDHTIEVLGADDVWRNIGRDGFGYSGYYFATSDPAVYRDGFIYTTGWVAGKEEYVRLKVDVQTGETTKE